MIMMGIIFGCQKTRQPLMIGSPLKEHVRNSSTFKCLNCAELTPNVLVAKCVRVKLLVGIWEEMWWYKKGRQEQLSMAKGNENLF